VINGRVPNLKHTVSCDRGKSTKLTRTTSAEELKQLTLPPLINLFDATVSPIYGLSSAVDKRPFDFAVAKQVGQPTKALDRCKGAPSVLSLQTLYLIARLSKLILCVK
jgi:hypothetical protein